MVAPVRGLLIVAAIAAVITGLGIVVLDATLARALGVDANQGAVPRTLDQAIHYLDLVSGMALPKEWFAAGLVALGAGLWWWKRDLGRAALLIGLTHAVARIAGSHIKPVFGRMRPREALAAGEVDSSFWHDGGIAFPSGHVGHYAALALTLGLLFPKARWPAAVVLGFVVLARVGVNAHFISDATGSIALAALAAAGFATLLRVRPWPWT